MRVSAARASFSPSSASSAWALSSVAPRSACVCSFWDEVSTRALYTFNLRSDQPPLDGGQSWANSDAADCAASRQCRRSATISGRARRTRTRTFRSNRSVSPDRQKASVSVESSRTPRASEFGRSGSCAPRRCSPLSSELRSPCYPPRFRDLSPSTGSAALSRVCCTSECV